MAMDAAGAWLLQWIVLHAEVIPMESARQSSGSSPAPAGLDLLMCCASRGAAREDPGPSRALESCRRLPRPRRTAELEARQRRTTWASEPLYRRGTANPSGG